MKPRIIFAIISLIFALPVVLFSQEVVTEFWFDDTSSQTTVPNHGTQGWPNGAFMAGLEKGDGISVGPLWSDTVNFEYEGNHSLVYDGGRDYVNVGNPAVEAFTIEAWVKPDSNKSSTYSYICQASDSARILLHFRVRNEPDHYEIGAYMWDYGTNGWATMRSADSAITAREWQHVALTYDPSGGAKLFVSGEEVASMPAVGEMVINNYWRIGHAFGSAPIGWIDDVRISNIPKFPGDGSGTGFNFAMNTPLRDLATDPPVVESPADSATGLDSTVTFTWAEVADAEGYRIQVSDTASFIRAFIDSSDLQSTSIDLIFPDTSRSYYWRVGATNDVGVSNYSPIHTISIQKWVNVVKESELPGTFHLGQNYPNPFNPVTTIPYTIPNNTHVSIQVYDVQGALIRTLVNETKEAGTHKVSFNGETLSSGIYFYRITTDDYTGMKKLLLVK